MTKIITKIKEYNKTKNAPKLTPGRYELMLSLSKRPMTFSKVSPPFQTLITA
jgi:hypothetical protein